MTNTEPNRTCPYYDSEVSCKCQSCGKQFRKDLIVPDKIWKKIRPVGKPKEGGLLCMSCIGERIESMDDEYGAFVLTEIQPQQEDE